MSCPYFDPVAPRLQATDPECAWLPLGGQWAGLCRAGLDDPSEPPETSLPRMCNLGYARGACSRFPQGEGPDAVRFTLSSDDGALLRLYYVLERGHHPFAYGPLEYSLAGDFFTTKPAGEWTLRQARAYIQSYLRLKAAAA